jgi:hypothetical protein
VTFVHVFVRIVMSDEFDHLAQKTLKSQLTIFRRAERELGLTRKMVASDSGIHYDTLGFYWRGERVMPLTALLKLCDVIPDHMLSILLDPVGRHLSTNDKRDGDLADLGREAANFTSAYVDAVSDGNVTPIEKAKLVDGARRVCACASNVIGDAAA